jgi:hypothetical protein
MKFIFSVLFAALNVAVLCVAFDQTNVNSFVDFVADSTNELNEFHPFEKSDDNNIFGQLKESFVNYIATNKDESASVDYESSAALKSASALTAHGKPRVDVDLDSSSKTSLKAELAKKDHTLTATADGKKSSKTNVKVGNATHSVEAEAVFTGKLGAKRLTGLQQVMSLRRANIEQAQGKHCVVHALSLDAVRNATVTGKSESIFYSNVLNVRSTVISAKHAPTTVLTLFDKFDTRNVTRGGKVYPHLVESLGDVTTIITTA